MTEDERKRIAAERKAAYRKRKKAELEELARQTPDKERERLFNAKARNITPELETAFSKADDSHKDEWADINAKARNIAPELETAFSKADDSHKDEWADMLAAAEERGRRTKLIMSMYERDAASPNKLLWHILETLTRMRLELTDLIGGLRNG